MRALNKEKVGFRIQGHIRSDNSETTVAETRSDN